MYACMHACMYVHIYTYTIYTVQSIKYKLETSWDIRYFPMVISVNNCLQFPSIHWNRNIAKVYTTDRYMFLDLSDISDLSIRCKLWDPVLCQMQSRTWDSAETILSKAPQAISLSNNQFGAAILFTVPVLPTWHPQYRICEQFQRTTSSV